MHHTIKKLFLFAVISAITISSAVIQAAPKEQESAILTRRAESGLQLSETLSKNLYRQEAVQVPYIIQEPYQVQETYYEQVPYDETEYYTDYEDYYDSDYQCENRNRDERICHDKESCHIVPGRGSDGSPRRECTKTPECRTETRTERVCDWVSVRKTRPVQKSRTVTRYRQEARTRSITRYRDKQVCCKTEYKKVFDRQFRLPVTIQFPAGTELQGTEQESFAIALEGSEAAPSISLKIRNSIFGYKITRQQMHGGGFEIELQAVALYSAEELGSASIKNLRLQDTPHGASISFTDAGLKPRIQTRYFYQIREVGMTEILATGEIPAGSAQVYLEIPQMLEESHEYQLELRLLRQGSPLAAPVDQILSVQKKVTPLQNEDLHKRRDQIRTFEVRGQGVETRLLFIDHSPQNEGVHTLYKIEVLLGGENSLATAVREFTREEMPMATKNFFRISFADDMGIPPKELIEKVRRGKSVTIRLTTTRENPRLNDGNPVILQHLFTQVVKN